MGRHLLGDLPAAGPVTPPGAGPGGVLWLECVVIGATPIVTLALSLLELIPLHIGGPALVGSALLGGLALLVLEPTVGRQAVRGYLAGLVAVLIYDGTRMPFVILGGWPDFIPKIGAWLLDEPTAPWLLGYTWRYLGNGAGMGLTFAMLVLVTDRWLDRRIAGVGYGVVIWSGLVATLLAAPAGEQKMFELNALTITVSLTGHLVYGGVLGSIMHRQRAR